MAVMKDMKKEYFVAALIFVLLIALGGGYLLMNRGKASGTPAAPGAVGTTTGAAGATTVTVTSGSQPTTQYSIAEIRSMMPDLNRQIQFSADVPTDARTQLTSDIGKIVATLKVDPTQLTDWLQLALLYHTANDFDGARLVWEFMTKVDPKDTTVYDNLGRLYSFDLKDYPKAEEYFKESIALDPKDTTPYYELFTLYRYSYKTDTTAAVDILMSWAKALPTDPQPYFTLGLYYRDLGQVSDAKTALTTALTKARAAGNDALALQISNELAKLPK